MLDEAQGELAAAIAHYEQIQPRLGIRLKEEVRDSLQRICENPDRAAVRPNGYRRVNLRVFPYYIAYVVSADLIWVLALAHTRRQPEYWIGRIANRPPDP